MIRYRSIAMVGALLIATACARGRYGPPPNAKAPVGTHTLKNLSVNEREALLERAQVWQPIDTRSFNLAAGPPLAPARTINADVGCTFVFPDKPLTGNTPKFLCELRLDDVVKVKYGEKNGEVYAEIAASRLFWALGFRADGMYPARVTCEGCPADPFVESKENWHIGRPGNVGRHIFDPAAIERPVSGSNIEVRNFEGWAWPELNKVNPRLGGASRAQVDALKLLAVFVQHSDSKPEQQDLLCPPGSVKRDRAGHETCALPWLVVSDLGTTFGKATLRNTSKMNLADWSGAGIWRAGSPCVGDLARSFTGSLENPRISEAGRRLLATRLLLLRDQQIHDLFSVARADHRGGTVDEWVRVFKRKRTEIVNARCVA
jgi:hypothetical protein